MNGMTTREHQSLNDRKQRLLDWLAAGRSNAQIGLSTGRSEKTNRNQLSSQRALGFWN